MNFQICSKHLNWSQGLGAQRRYDIVLTFLTIPDHLLTFLKNIPDMLGGSTRVTTFGLCSHIPEPPDHS